MKVKPQRQIKAGYANLTAKVPSNKLNRMVDAESSLERDFILLLEFDEQVINYVEQPVVLPMGKNRTYTPDFLANFRDENGDEFTYIYEVKYRDELRKNWAKLKPKFKAAIRYCNEHGYRFKIVTEKEIRTDKLKNIEFLQHVSRTVSHSEAAFRDALSVALNELKVATPNEVLVFAFASKLKRAEALPVMWRMIAEGSIEADLNSPLNMNSQLTLCTEIEDRLW